MIEHHIDMDAQVELPEAINVTALASLITHVLGEELIEDAWSIGIQFVDDPTMQAAHLEFMDINESTDIMTFPYAEDDEVWGDTDPGGDLMISVDRARDNASAAHWNNENEIFFLIIHGLLHLRGWDDHDDADRARMLARQKELLESWPGVT